MFYMKLFLISLATSSAAAADSDSIVCVAGQCLKGAANTTLGATLSIPSNPSIILLPGQYTSSSQPQLLHDALSSNQASLSLPTGFSNSSQPPKVSLPLTVALQPGALSYSQSFYQGPSSFTSPSSANKPITPASLSAGSLLVAPNTWAALTSSNTRLIIWDAVPDFSQLPASAINNAFLLADIQSGACSPACASTGTCTPDGKCQCLPGFNGDQCETCADGFFGKSCQPCPGDCDKCDQGLTGTGKCLVPKVDNKPESCNCLNGVCGGDGKCQCNSGWTNSNNGTACASCSPGFFSDGKGNCAACSAGCTQCSDGTGECTSCQSGFTPDANNKADCVPESTVTNQCPDGSFSSNGQCVACSASCGSSCSGPSASECLTCSTGRYLSSGQCISADGNGVCTGTKLFANNLKHVCDACPAKCTECQIPSFNSLSLPTTIQCTACLPGSVLSNGTCIESCPDGSFLGSDGFTCTSCDSSCKTCVGGANFCLTCASSQLALNGSCTTNCPSETFSSSGACLSCHPDCATCSGGAFNQCLTCSSSRPVLTSDGRCAPTCAKNEFLDSSSGRCVQCDPACSSCAGSGSSQCLACSDKSSVLKAGSCVKANCTSQSSVIPGLGVCLSQLVTVDPKNPTTPLPTFTPPPPKSNDDSNQSSGGRKLTWWEILLMALGCAFIFVVILWLWRRHARKKRAKRTAVFASRLDQRAVWRKRLARFADMFKNAKNGRRTSKETEYDRLAKLREAEAMRHAHEMKKIESAYAKSLSNITTGASARDGKLSRQPSIASSYYSPHKAPVTPSPLHHTLNVNVNANRTSAPSLYSQLTRQARSGPDPKQPTHELDLDMNLIDLERGDRLLSSRFSVTTAATSIHPQQPEELPPLPASQSEAEGYAAAHRPVVTQIVPPPPPPQQAPSYWIIPGESLMPAHTGDSTSSSNSGSSTLMGSRNPFRNLT